MRIGRHQATGKISVSNKQKSGGKFIFFGGNHGHLNLSRLVALADPIPRDQFESLHIFRGNLQRVDLALVFFLEFSLADPATLLAGATRYEDESLAHQKQVGT